MLVLIESFQFIQRYNRWYSENIKRQNLSEANTFSIAPTQAVTEKI